MRGIRAKAVLASLLALACSRPDAEFGAWIEAKAIPLRTSDPFAPLDDLEPLRGLIGNATVVGLGEGTHGTREFSRMKHRIFEFLVERMGFTVFAIEANLPEAFAVNDYILTGKGDPKAALQGLYFWTSNTTEVLDLIEWMRRWNADPRHTKKLKFYGVDMQFTTVAARNVIAALPAGDPARDALQPLSFKRRPSADAKQTLERIIPTLKDEVVRRNAIVLRQALLIPTSVAVRDEAMAENLLWIRQQEPGAKIALWAHNGHIGRSSPFYPTLGSHLTRALSADYVAVCLASGDGSFRARDFDDPRRPIRTFKVSIGKRGTLDGELARHGPPIFLLDARTAPPSLRNGMKVRFIGAGFSDTTALRDYKQDDFDLIVFIRHTTASQPVEPTASISSSSSRRQMSASSTSSLACGIAARSAFAISTSAALRR
jgi:erythromycin esterase